MTVWMDNDDSPPNRRISSASDQPRSVVTPKRAQYHFVRTIKNGVKTTHIHRVMKYPLRSNAACISRVTQTYAGHTRSCHFHSQPNHSQHSQNKPVAQSNNSQPNQQPRLKESQNQNEPQPTSPNNEIGEEAAPKTDSNENKSNKDSVPKPILKERDRVKKVRFSDPIILSSDDRLSSTRATREQNNFQTRQNRPNYCPPSSAMPARGPNPPRPKRRSTVPPRRRPQRALPISQQLDWSDISSNNDDDERIQLKVHTPKRATKPLNPFIQGQNPDHENGLRPMSFYVQSPRRRHHAREPFGPSYTDSWDISSDTDSNIDDLGDNFLSSLGKGIPRGNFPHSHNPHRPSSSSPPRTSSRRRRHANRPVNYVQVYTRADCERPGGWGCDDIRELRSVFRARENNRGILRNHDNQRSSMNSNRNNNNHDIDRDGNTRRVRFSLNCTNDNQGGRRAPGGIDVVKPLRSLREGHS